MGVDLRKAQFIVEGAVPTPLGRRAALIGRAHYDGRFVEPRWQMAVPLSVTLKAQGSPTAWFAWTPEAQESFELAPSTLPVLHWRTFCSTRGADEGREQHLLVIGRSDDPDSASRLESASPCFVFEQQLKADSGGAKLPSTRCGAAVQWCTRRFST
jgi:hypothetical protein